jgi:hypothetical protein
MKLILLICLIGAAMSAELLTTGTTTLWTLTYLTPAATTTNYNLTLAYSTGVTTGTTEVSSGSTMQIGVVCLTTVANFSLVAASSNAGFGFGSQATAASAINSITGWGALTLHILSAVTYTTDVLLTQTALGSACTLVSATAPTWAAYVHTYTFSSVAVCGNLGIMGGTWYARCFHKTSTAVIIGASSLDLVVSAAKNVTVGASNLAVGATILAGIAYLQF